MVLAETYLMRKQKLAWTEKVEIYPPFVRLEKQTEIKPAASVNRK